MLLPAQIIQKKRDGHALTEEEIRFFIPGFTRGEIPDYQMSALAMAICFQGMDFDETLWLTRAMIDSGQTIQWKTGGASVEPRLFYADKHSTGGIGDKVSLLLAPLVACCGVRVPMISGRGLGPTGGTLDKLESIAGYRTDLTLDEFVEVVDTVGCAISGQTAEIVPADKKLYALRDVTASVSCLPLIVASIMSKKLAENVDGLVLDVKWGSGAFMRTRETSRDLARAMVEVGKRFGKKVVALQTDMNQPLGGCIGNALEVRECLDILTGEKRPDDLVEVTLALATEILTMAGIAHGRVILEKHLATGAGFEKFSEMIEAQGGEPGCLPVAKSQRPINSTVSGYVHGIACDQIGYAVIALGGGRRQTSDTIDFAVGFEHPTKIGDQIEVGEPLMQMHFNDHDRAAAAEQMVRAAYDIPARASQCATSIDCREDRMMPTVNEAKEFLTAKLAGFQPEVALITGSGLGGIASALSKPLAISYSDIPHFPQPTVAGHAGQMFFGELAGKRLMILCGRFHYYEGRPIAEIVHPIHVVAALGVKTLIVTNAAGGINPGFNPGDLMLITDHINFMGVNPLTGYRDHQFIDMSEAYSLRLRQKFETAAAKSQVAIQRGVYLATAGPNYETPAEIKAFARLGADAVGMSTVPEVIMARYHQIEVAGISCITNLAAGISKNQLSHQEVLAGGQASQANLIKLLTEFLSQL